MAPPERSDVSQSDLRPKGVYYLVTIKRVKLEFCPRNYLHAHYKRIVNLLQGAQWSDVVAYELDSLNRLHLHTIVYCEKRPYLKGLQRKGWTIHFQEFPLSDYPRVRNYLDKVNQNPYYLDQIESESYTYLQKDPFNETT